jgi:hypothetical protein
MNDEALKTYKHLKTIGHEEEEINAKIQLIENTLMNDNLDLSDEDKKYNKSIKLSESNTIPS